MRSKRWILSNFMFASYVLLCGCIPRRTVVYPFLEQILIDNKKVSLEELETGERQRRKVKFAHAEESINLLTFLLID
jgi:uncharacterized protein YbaP (TraB family)